MLRDLGTTDNIATEHEHKARCLLCVKIMHYLLFMMHRVFIKPRRKYPIHRSSFPVKRFSSAFQSVFLKRRYCNFMLAIKLQ